MIKEFRMAHFPDKTEFKLFKGSNIIRQRVDLFEANISANKIGLPPGQSYTEREYYKQ